MKNFSILTLLKTLTLNYLLNTFLVRVTAHKWDNYKLGHKINDAQV